MPVLDAVINDFMNSYANMELISVMAYPNNEDLRKQYKATCSSKIMAEIFSPEIKEEILKDSGLKPKGISRKKWKELADKFVKYSKIDLENLFLKSGEIPTLYNSPTHAEIMKQLNFSSFKGMLAGQVLTYIWQISVSEIRGEGSVNKAISLLLEKKRDQIINQEYPFNEKFIRQLWAEYKSVSHLWAAWNHWHVSGEPEKWSPYGGIASLRLSGFISLSEKFRLFGISHIPRAQRTSSLPPDEIWLPPENFKLEEFDFEVPSLSAEELKTLKNYRAPQKL